MNNEVRRTRKKLELMDQEGLYGVLFDLIDLLAETRELPPLDEQEKQQTITLLKQRYGQFIRNNTPNSLRQGELFAGN